MSGGAASRTTKTRGHTGALEWAAASRPFAGEIVTGDAAIVLESNGRTLAAVVDGLGHGKSAAAAAERAIASVTELAAEPLDELVRGCHERLLRTRGVAMTVARIDPNARVVEWIGVGNVECLLVGSGETRRESAPLRGGVVGYQLPVLRSTTADLHDRDLLVFATDGVGSQFADGLSVRIGDPEWIAAQLIDKHGKSNDDALALVGRFERGSAK
jgi:negative regulator of sigma-B (phosphoserine phosphatase)